MRDLQACHEGGGRDGGRHQAMHAEARQSEGSADIAMPSSCVVRICNNVAV